MMLSVSVLVLSPGVQMQKSLPSSCYTSPRIFAREQEQIFAQEWFCAGREEDLASAGDWRVLDVAGESVLVVRNKSG